MNEYLDFLNVYTPAVIWTFLLLPHPSSFDQMISASWSLEVQAPEWAAFLSSLEVSYSSGWKLNFLNQTIFCKLYITPMLKFVR